MSIESRHAYRFGYLKSEQWKNVRLEALVREKGRCQICGEESGANDAHHIWYPSNIYETTVDHLAVLCRPCHEFIHAMRPECKTSDEQKGREEWLLFRNSIMAWRLFKCGLFNELPDVPGIHGMKRLRDAYDEAKREVQAYKAVYGPLAGEVIKKPIARKPKSEFSPQIQGQLNTVFRQITQWAKSHQLMAHDFFVDSPDFQI